ncbi:hypothetical protein FKP32DRAFT_206913 [Trametes sanguinea]|nr:hypothetical protein FKP32DRAFT_206913 [Trametes sanguinea]
MSPAAWIGTPERIKHHPCSCFQRWDGRSPGFAFWALRLLLCCSASGLSPAVARLPSRTMISIQPGLRGHLSTNRDMSRGDRRTPDLWYTASPFRQRSCVLRIPYHPEDGQIGPDTACLPLLPRRP